MHWEDVEQHQPRLAAAVGGRLIEPGVLLVASIRGDGTPRISPVEPYILDGRLLLSMLWGSMKATDLLRDPRILVHSIVTGPDGAEGEAKLRGRAVPEDRPEAQRRYAEAVSANLGWRPEPGRFHLFAVEVGDVVFIRYDAATGDQFVACWPPPREFVRRGTSATTVGDPEPVRNLIVPE
jgi:hypothetical protein